MNHPSMTSNGRRLAGLIAVVIAFFLPKRVDCGYPGGSCDRIVEHRMCHAYELEPLGFYGIEYVLGRDVGFAYSSGDDC